MSKLAEAFANLGDSQQITMVKTYVGNLLFGLISRSNASEYEMAKAQAELTELMRSELVAALPAEDRAHLEQLNQDARKLLEMPVE